MGKKDKPVVIVSMSQVERAEIWDDPLIKEEEGGFIFIFKPDIFTLVIRGAALHMTIISSLA